jgi:transcriptional regulator with XRE-family HTH domain
VFRVVADAGARIEVMRRKSYAFVRSHRRKWGLTQVELARLIGLSSRSAVSRIERAERVPTTATIIACGIIFGLATHDLFPSLQEEIEEAVLLVIASLQEELAGQSDKASTRKRALLTEVQERINNRDKQQIP